MLTIEVRASIAKGRVIEVHCDLITLLPQAFCTTTGEVVTEELKTIFCGVIIATFTKNLLVEAARTGVDSRAKSSVSGIPTGVFAIFGIGFFHQLLGV